MGFPILCEENRIYLTKRKPRPKSDSSPSLCKAQKTPLQKRKSPPESDDPPSTKFRKVSRFSSLFVTPPPTFPELPPHDQELPEPTRLGTIDLVPDIPGKLQEEIVPGNEAPASITYHCSHTKTPEDYFESPVFTVFIGRERAAFLLPLKLACHKSGKFRRRYENSWLQAGTSLSYDTISVELFRVWFAWVYGNNSLSGLDMKTLYRLYYLAADLQSGDLCNAVLDNIRKHHLKEGTWPKLERVVHVYENTTLTSPLRTWVVSCVHYRLMILKEEMDTYFGTSAMNTHFVRDFVRLTQESLESPENDDPRIGGGCQYHVHEPRDNAFPSSSATAKTMD
ncbi:hypothetical protein MMC17_005565 [Xylographa soralifera]|nr:hypothetical protein [Xylographa soralifera]